MLELGLVLTAAAAAAAVAAWALVDLSSIAAKDPLGPGYADCETRGSISVWWAYAAS
jgi:hypothetical protein